jgi:hypothetical protein
MATLTEPKSEYLLDHDWEAEPRRLELLEEHADPTTIRRLEATGIGEGWRWRSVQVAARLRTGSHRGSARPGT